MSDKKSGDQSSESAAERVAASLGEQAHFRSMSLAMTDPIPLQQGDPVPGGIRPGPDTSHTIITESGSPEAGSPQAESSQDAGGEGSSASQPE